jgi:hypothetical protein
MAINHIFNYVISIYSQTSESSHTSETSKSQASERNVADIFFDTVSITCDYHIWYIQCVPVNVYIWVLNVSVYFIRFKYCNNLKYFFIDIYFYVIYFILNFVGC